MSITLPAVNLASATVGTSGFIDLSNVRLQPTIAQLANGLQERIVFYNESGCGLTVTFDGSNSTYFLPAGAWHEPIDLNPNDTRILWTVSYLLPNAPVSQLITIYFQASETLSRANTLGNSPIGVTGTVVTSTLSTIEGDLFSPYVVFGLTQVKDGVIASQLDVASGEAMLVQPDGTLAVRKPAQTTFSTAPFINTAVVLDLNPDGTYVWGTAGSSNPNALHISRVNTDGSGNITTVIDQRQTTTTFVPGMTGVMTLPSPSFNGPVTAINGVFLGGALGVPGIVFAPGPTLRTHVTTTGSTTIVTGSPQQTGLYRASGFLRLNNGTNNNNVALQVTYFDPDKVGGTSDNASFVGNTGGASVQLTGLAAVANNPYAIEPLTFMHTGGKAITIAYNDPTNTPNDFISVAVERLA